MGLTYSSVVDASLDEASAWHTRPGAVTRLVPPWRHMFGREEGRNAAARVRT